MVLQPEHVHLCSLFSTRITYIFCVSYQLLYSRWGDWSRAASEGRTLRGGRGGEGRGGEGRGRGGEGEGRGGEGRGGEGGEGRGGEGRGGSGGEEQLLLQFSKVPREQNNYG